MSVPSREVRPEPERPRGDLPRGYGHDAAHDLVVPRASGTVRTASLPPAALPALQRRAGNAAVARALARPSTPTTTSASPAPDVTAAGAAPASTSDAGPVVQSATAPPGPAAPAVQRGVWGTITGAVSGAASAVTSGVRERVLGTIGTWARRIPGYGVLCVALGRDVITQLPVTRDATSIIGALVGLVPGGSAIWENLQQSGAVARAGEWVSGELQRLNLTWDAIRGLFSRAWDAVGASDLLHPAAVWERLSGIFSAPIARLRQFASAAGGKLMEFVFEGVLTTAGGAGGQVMGIVRQAGDVLGTIVRNPIGFAGNLVAAVRGGIGQFAGNIFTHLRTGLIGWLTGALRGAMQLPTRFDLGGIFTMVTSMLGLTWQWLRGRIVAVVGEPLVRRVETAVDWIRTLVTDGIGGLVGRLGDMVSGLLDTVIGGIRDWVANSVVGAAVTRLISMFNPAGAVIQAIIAVYNTIKFFIERAQQLGALAQSVFGSIAAIASGSVGSAVNAVEQALGRAVPVVLGFLSRLIGLGDVAAPVRNVIERIRGVIDRAMDRVVGWVVTAARRIGGAVRAGAGGAPEQRGVTAAVREAGGLLRAPGATAAAVRAALPALRQRHGLRSAELVPDGARGVHVHLQREEGDTPVVQLPEDPRVPRRHADGIAAVEVHGEQGSRNRNGQPIHWLESEHVMPFRIGALLWEELDLPRPRRGGTLDRGQHTIMLYKGAADRKTRSSAAGEFRAHADWPLIRLLKAVVERGLAARRRRRDGTGTGEEPARPGGPAPAQLGASPEGQLLGQTGAQVIERARINETLEVVRAHAVMRTNRAVVEDYATTSEGVASTHAQRRGVPPERPRPEPSEVEDASRRQLADVRGMAAEAVDEVLEERRAAGP